MAIFDVPRAGTRLVTQNLLVSAAAAAMPDRYVDEENVADLATVITLACMYDRLVLVGPSHLLDGPGEFLHYLRTSLVETRDPADKDWKRAVRYAETYLGAFLKKGRIREAEPIFAEILHMSRRVGVDRLDPDGPDDLALGRELLDGVNDSDDLRERLQSTSNRIVVAFVLRTFLYLALADKMRIPLAGDSTRHDLLSEIAKDSQTRLREAILATMTDGVQAAAHLSRPLRTIASPYSAIVFSQSNERNDLVPRLRELREQQLSFRLSLRPFEEKLELAMGGELAQVQAHTGAAIDALEDTYGVKGAEDLTIYHVIGAAKPIADLLAGKPSAIWQEAARKLVAKDARIALAELHKLHRKLPSTATQDRDIERLFDL